MKCPKCFTNQHETLFRQQRFRNRQETVSKRFKNWSILKQVYCHDTPHHCDDFWEISMYLSISKSEPLFECRHIHPPYNDEISELSEDIIMPSNDTNLSYDQKRGD